MKSLSIILMPILVALGVLSCKNDDGTLTENCCSSATNFTVGNGKVYIPNIFTPNADGLNDGFYPFADTDIETILNFEIKNSNGFVLASHSNFEPNDPTGGWSPTNQEATEGQFNYSIAVKSTDGTEKTITGKVCSKPNGFDETLCNTCHFATQHDGLGGFCTNCASLEPFCP